MRLVGLISGGKDSLYNMLQCVAAGHEIVAVANIEPESRGMVKEMDSFMYQSVGHELITLIGGALCLPIFRQKTLGQAICTSKVYSKTVNDEVEDLMTLLSKVKKEVGIDGVAVGAIASDYQRTRVESVCSRLGLKCFAYLWRRNQAELLQEMIDAEVDAIIVKVACIGLSSKHLGMDLKEIQPHLIELNKKYGVNICGEGGEYETMTLDCSLFLRSITITDSEKVVLSNDPFAPVACLLVKKAGLNVKHLEKSGSVITQHDKINMIRSTIKNPYNYVEDCFDELSEAIFPQKKRAAVEDLPFPFDNLGAGQQSSSVQLQEYWKQPSLMKPQSNAKLLASGSMLLTDLSTVNLHFSSGWCCIGNVVGSTVSDALNLVRRHLQRMKYEFQEVVFINVYVKDISDFNNINAAYSEFMPESHPPARSCVEIPLPPDVGAMLIVVAHKMVSKCQKAIGTCAVDRESMHVQSISHWAPANIGPYSQCVRISGIYYISGQIPLIPGTMELLNKPILHQCSLTLRHVLRILQAMNEGLNFSNVIQAICYVTAEEFASDVYSQWLHVTKGNSAPVAVVVVTSLPKKAQMEWEVIACSFKSHCEVHETTEIVEDLSMDMKIRSSTHPFACSIVGNMKYTKKTKSEARIAQRSPKGIRTALQRCVEILRREYKSSGLPICVLKLFFKANDHSLSLALGEIIPSLTESKAIATAIPVVACENRDIILTVTGVCV